MYLLEILESPQLFLGTQVVPVQVEVHLQVLDMLAVPVEKETEMAHPICLDDGQQ